MSPYAFSICDTSSFGAFLEGGTCIQVKVPTSVSFVSPFWPSSDPHSLLFISHVSLQHSLATELHRPSLLTADLSKMSSPPNIHLGLRALHQFRATQHRLPNVQCPQDAAALVDIAKDINAHLECPVEPLDTALISQMACTAQGNFPPLCASLGGIAAQEALKALTGKFSPLQQWVSTLTWCYLP